MLRNKGGVSGYLDNLDKMPPKKFSPAAGLDKLDKMPAARRAAIFFGPKIVDTYVKTLKNTAQRCSKTPRKCVSDLEN